MAFIHHKWVRSGRTLVNPENPEEFKFATKGGDTDNVDLGAGNYAPWVYSNSKLNYGRSVTSFSSSRQAHEHGNKVLSSTKFFITKFNGSQYVTIPHGRPTRSFEDHGEQGHVHLDFNTSTYDFRVTQIGKPGSSGEYKFTFVPKVAGDYIIEWVESGVAPRDAADSLPIALNGEQGVRVVGVEFKDIKYRWDYDEALQRSYTVVRRGNKRQLKIKLGSYILAANEVLSISPDVFGPVTIAADNRDGQERNDSVWSTAGHILNGNVGTWHFNEGSGASASDNSGSGNNGVLNGTPSWVTGKVGSALSFSGGSDRVLISDNPSLDIQNEITLAMWIRPTTQTTQYPFKKADVGLVDGFELSLSSGGTVFVRFNQASSGNLYRLKSTSNYPTDGVTWMHVAVTYDGSIIKLYINGVLESTKTETFTIAANNLDLSIGAQYDGQYPFIGSVDEVYIANLAGSATDIAILFAADTALDSDGDGVGLDGDGNVYDMGMSWDNVTVPSGATISAAAIELFMKWQPGTVDIVTRMQGFDVDDVAVFSSTNRPSQIAQTTALNNRTYLGATDWSDESRLALDDAATIFQEIIDRAGWASGQALGVVLKDSGSSTGNRWKFQDYGNSVSDAATLEITYTVPTVSVSVTADVVLQDSLTATTSADVVLQDSLTATTSADVVLQSSEQSNCRADAIIFPYQPFPVGWEQRQKLTIFSANISSNLADYPVVVTRTEIDNNTVDPVGANRAQADGGDVRFSSDLQGQARLACEVVAFGYDSVLGAGDADIEIHVKVASVASGTDTDIYLWHRTVDTQVQPIDIAPFGTDSVWDDDFLLVLHMQDNPALGSVVSDSTQYNHLAFNSGLTAGSSVPGAFGGKGLYLDGSQDIKVFNTVDLSGFAAFTFEMWINVEDTKDPITLQDAPAYAKGLPGSEAYLYDFDALQRGVFTFSPDSNAPHVGGGDFVSLLAWQKRDVVYDGTTVDVVTDGVTVDSDPVTGVVAAEPSDLIIGRDDSPSRITATFDEFRISRVARSVSWRSATHTNQKTPNVFWGAGPSLGVTGGSLSADAVLVYTVLGLVQADGVLATRGVSSASFDTMLSRTQNSTLSTDATIQKVNSGTVIADSILEVAALGNITLDALVAYTQSELVTADTLLSLEILGVFSAGAYLESSEQSTVASDAVLAVIVAKQAGISGADAVLISVQGAQVSSDALLMSAKQTSIPNVDAVLAVRRLDAVTPDALLEATELGSVTSDSVLTGLDSSVLLTEALLSKRTKGFTSLDAVLALTNTLQVSADAVVLPFTDRIVAIDMSVRRRSVTMSARRRSVRMSVILP